MSMKLSALNARFIDAGGGARGVGVMMDCPAGCPDHLLYVGFSVALDGTTILAEPNRRVWRRTGDTIETLTLDPSVHRLDRCGWHGWIRNGEALP